MQFILLSLQKAAHSILWRDPTKSLEAAKAMKLTAGELLKINIIDEIIQEPIGGAHRNKEEVLSSTKVALIKYLEEFKNYHQEKKYLHKEKKIFKYWKTKKFYCIFKRCK